MYTHSPSGTGLSARMSKAQRFLNASARAASTALRRDSSAAPMVSSGLSGFVSSSVGALGLMVVVHSVKRRRATGGAVLAACSGEGRDRLILKPRRGGRMGGVASGIMTAAGSWCVVAFMVGVDVEGSCGGMVADSSRVAERVLINECTHTHDNVYQILDGL